MLTPSRRTSSASSNSGWSAPSSAPAVTHREAAVLIATILMGTLAGFFLTYGFTITPALATVDDYTFVAAFQGLERMFGTSEYGFN